MKPTGKGLFHLFLRTTDKIKDVHQGDRSR